jgi:NDP-sugar pyrophosphorylase family protein
MRDLSAEHFFDLSQFAHAALFDGTTYVWEAVDKIEQYVHQQLSGQYPPNGSSYPLKYASSVIGEQVYIGEGTHIDPGVYIEGPAIIGRNCSLRHGAYIRENVILGDGVIVGNSCELKNAVALDDASIPHFAYCGDSLLGARINLGAGTKLSNLAVTSAKDKATGRRPTIILDIDGEKIDTGLVKLGAVLGDDVQIGCNSVTNPGTLIGRRTLVYALASLPKGYYPPDSIIKVRQTVEVVQRSTR